MRFAIPQRHRTVYYHIYTYNRIKLYFPVAKDILLLRIVHHHAVGLVPERMEVHLQSGDFGPNREPAGWRQSALHVWFCNEKEIQFTGISLFGFPSSARRKRGRTCPVPSERRLDDGNTLWDFTSCFPKSTLIRAARPARFGLLALFFWFFSGLMLALGAIFLYHALIGSMCLLSAFLRCSLWFGKGGSWR